MTPSDKVIKIKSVAKRFEQLEQAATTEKDNSSHHCQASDRGMFVCTRPKGHDGMHIAMAGSSIFHVWR